MALNFKPHYFNPYKTGARDEARTLVAVPGGAGKVAYVYTDAIVLAVNLALATNRPLFVAGEPGTGKTTLARNVAQVLGWRYYQAVITSRTQSKDLMWTFDALRRLSDAYEPGKTLPPRAAYIQPQVLWWAFDPASAKTRGAAGDEARRVTKLDDPAAGETSSTKAVVLLDEIDKADPDVPNDLLEALDVAQFKVEELDEPRVIKAKAERLLVMITSNGERELPPAFLRRCVVLQLDEPNEDWLVTIANQRYGRTKETFHRMLAQRVMEMRGTARAQRERGPSTAEYLDTVVACQELDIDTSSDIWKRVTGSLLMKRERPG
jgi:MoxR-like ATPase